MGCFLGCFRKYNKKETGKKKLNPCCASLIPTAVALVFDYDERKCKKVNTASIKGACICACIRCFDTGFVGNRF